MAYSSNCEHEMESNIEQVTNYLERYVLGEEKCNNVDRSCASGSGAGANATTGFNRRSPPTYIPSLPPPAVPINIFPHNFGASMPTSQYPLTSVTSALATRMGTYSSTLRFVTPPTHSKARKWGNYKQPEKEPDTSGIDIEATMAELGLTPQSLTNNEVYRLFSMYNKLAFYIHAEYIFQNIFEGRTLPNTMSASAQTRHAVWASNKLLYQLRESLKKHVYVPSQYQGPFAECKQALEELRVAILKLETFKYCILEHRRGKFISAEGRANLVPLMESLNELIECVGKSRMYIQVIDSALSKCQPRLGAVADNSCEEPPQPATDGNSLEQPAKSSRTAARRYIG